MTLIAPAIPIIGSSKEIGSRYRAWVVDIWGVMHNGHRAFPGAVAAARRFREHGGIIVLLSNSPRPTIGVQEQLRRLGVSNDAYDATVTSGDLTRYELGKHEVATVFHLGPERDLPIFDGIPRKLVMICANPDHLVERGDKLVYCAGALAAIYEKLGGPVIYAGKPYAPIYALALKIISDLAGRTVTKDEVLAIGDGVNTDIAGAAGFGIDAVFVASGLHVPANSGGEAGPETLDERHLAELFADAKRRPLGAMRALAW